MTTLESFRVIAAVGAAIATLGLLAPSRGDTRRIASLGMLCGSWVLLAGSLVSRTDAEKIADRFGSAARIGLGVVAAVVGLAAIVLLVRLIIRRPAIWLVMLGLALPIRIPVTLGSQSANLLLPLYVVIALGVIALVWRARLGGPSPAPTPSALMDLPLGLFVAFSLVSTAWSADISEATVKMVFFYIPFVVLYRVTISWWSLTERPLRPVAVTSVSLGVLVACLAVFQYLTRTIWWNDTLKQGNIYNRFFRANGIFFDPNMLGRFLVLCMVAALAYLVVVDERAHTVILTVAILVMTAGLTVSFSRSSALALLVALALMAARVFGVRRTLVIGVGALVLVGGPIVALNGNVRDKVTSIERLANSGEGRLRLVKGGVELWKHDPVVGVGLGAFADRYKETLPRRTQLRTRVFISHTAPVTVLAELGTIGIGLLVLVLATGVVAMLRSARRRDATGLAIWTVLALTVAIFVHSILYSAFFEDPYLWFLAAAAGAMAAAPALAPSRDDPTGALTRVTPLPTG